MLMHFVGFYPASTQWMSPCSFVLKVYNVTFLCFSGACSYPVYLHLLFARHTGLGCPFGPKHLPDKCQIVLRQKRNKFFFLFFFFLWSVDILGDMAWPCTAKVTVMSLPVPAIGRSLWAWRLQQWQGDLNRQLSHGWAWATGRAVSDCWVEGQVFFFSLIFTNKPFSSVSVAVVHGSISVFLLPEFTKLNIRVDHVVMVTYLKREGCVFKSQQGCRAFIY